jgi:sugar/nucleoside kinase (ribokinase family)
MPPVRLPFRLLDRGSRPFDVAGLGLNSIDLVAVVAEHPSANSKQPVLRFAHLPGGQIATALIACARLGWRASYVGRFGGDDFGRHARESLVQAGVDVHAAKTVAEATNQFAMVLVSAQTGERTVLWHRHPALSMGPCDVPAEFATLGRIVIVDCHDTLAAAEAAASARAAGSMTIVDVERVRPGIIDLLQHIDAIIAAEAFPAELTGVDQPGRALELMARELGAAVVCVTLGEGGSLARAGGREIRTRGFPIDCVDSTGAGDAFRGGFAAGCLGMPDGDLEDVLEYANAVAALNCRALGAQGGLPTADEVDELRIARADRGHDRRVAR